jgi:hypothetical protein
MRKYTYQEIQIQIENFIHSQFTNLIVEIEEQEI